MISEFSLFSLIAILINTTYFVILVKKG